MSETNVSETNVSGAKPKRSDAGPGSEASPIWARLDSYVPGYGEQRALVLGLGSALELAERIDYVVRTHLRRGRRDLGDCVLIRVDNDGLRVDIY